MLTTRATPAPNKIQRIYVDSRDLVTHVNNNPNTYTITLTDAIPNVSRIRLVDYYIPYSPTIVVYIHTNGPEEIHANLVRAAGLYRLGNPMPITISADGWKLHVIELFVTSNSTDDNVAHLVCSGTYPLASAPDGSGTITDDCIMVIEWQNEDRYSETITGMRVQIKPVDIVLNVDMNQGVEWMVSDRPVVTEVLEGSMMRAGDVIRMNENGTTHAINEPFVYDQDFDENITRKTVPLAIDTVRRPAFSRTAFHVFRSPSMIQTTLVPAYAPMIDYQFKPILLREIDIKWTAKTGSDHVFPLDGIYYSPLVRAAVGDGAARVYKHHILVFDVYYQTR